MIELAIDTAGHKTWFQSYGHGILVRLTSTRPYRVNIYETETLSRSLLFVRKASLEITAVHCIS